jgi:hypothetical protein
MSLRLSLTPEVQGQFEAAAEAAGTSIAEQVRWRAEWLLALEPLDKPTLDLMAGIACMAAELERETGASWHAHAGTYEALCHGLFSWLGRLKPAGDLAFGPRPHRAELLDDPAEIGMMIAAAAWGARDMTPAERQKSRLMREESAQEVLKLRQQREQKSGDNGEDKS